ncbi:hypothetical protein A6U92_18715 [Agrobacterium rubi]|nr:hypothetical protein A6U92_18715 [Agrobacterium rubi]
MRVSADMKSLPVCAGPYLSVATASANDRLSKRGFRAATIAYAWHLRGPTCTPPMSSRRSVSLRIIADGERRNCRPLRRIRPCGEAAASPWRCQPAILEGLKDVKQTKILCLNKIDQVQREDLLTLASAANEIVNFDRTFMISATNGSGCDDLMNYLSDELPEGPWYYPEDQISDLPMKLMQLYRDGDLNLDQLMAFAVTQDHFRQEQVHAGLGYNREPWIIHRDLTRTHVQANDLRAVSVGPEAYTEAGGTIARDLFTEDRSGYYDDPALLDRLVLEKLVGIATGVQAEGWKWAEAFIDFPHAHGFRRIYPRPLELSEEDTAAHVAAQDEFDRLTAEWESADYDLPPDVDERFAELEAEIERIDGLRNAYEADEIARGGVFVVLNHDGEVRIERGFLRPEDETPEPEVEDGSDGNVGRPCGEGAMLSGPRT